jgi:putative ABC transport system permease protein
MAWRDSRTHRKRLALFMTSIIMGVAALVSIGSFRDNLHHTIDGQAKTLLGADLMVSNREPLNDEIAAFLDSLGGERAEELSFVSMIYFVKTNDTRLVQIRGMRGDFPFYGSFGTAPVDARYSYMNGARALLDESLLLQFGAQPGDSVRVGSPTYVIEGALRKLPSEPPIRSTFNPRVYVPLDQIDPELYLTRGSLVRYQYYFKFGEEKDLEALEQALEPRARDLDLRLETALDRKQRIGRRMDNLYNFLNLVGFVSLILGGVGIASSVHVYIKQKLSDIAILRCVGAKSSQTFSIYLIQVMAMAFVSSLLGAGLGVTVQMILPAVVSDFLPVDIDLFISWGELAKGVISGCAFALLFALPPLFNVRHVSPLLSLRSSFESEQPAPRVVSWLLYGLCVLGVGVFAILQTGELDVGFGFTVGVVVVFVVLSAVAKGISILAVKFFPSKWPFEWRQGMANLYRPNNQTLILLVSIGLGTFLISNLYLSQNLLLDKVSWVADEGRPNLIFFDIQPDQNDKVKTILAEKTLPILQEAPIVTMRIAQLKGREVQEIRKDTTESRRLQRALGWEYRATYRNHLLESEKIIAGRWHGDQVNGAEGRIPEISFADEQAERLGLAIGDTIEWDVQGVRVKSRLTSLREVDWERIQANFMVVFQEGALEYAPQIFVLATNTPTTEISADLQREVVRTFPNISMIDLELVLTTLDSFLDKTSFVIRFMAFFSIMTGLIVLTSAIITSRFQRIQESILLRTLGALRAQVRKIMFIEYLFLGSLAALTGIALACLSAWLLGFLMFDVTFVPTWLPIISVFVTVALLTILIGLGNSRGILDRPPLEVLRSEV